MSDTMFYGVLRMPFEMAMQDHMSRRQFYTRVQEAADRVEAADNRIAELVKEAQWDKEWYARRFEALRVWALTLPEPQQTEYFNILANGKARP